MTNTNTYWLKQKWGDLVLDKEQEFPDAWSTSSHKKFIFKCDCGANKLAPMKEVTSAKKASCGKCNWYPKEHWLQQHWGKLRLDPEQELPNKWPPGSNLLMWVVCDCGSRIQIKPNSLRKDYTSCGHCDDRPKEYWLSHRWGALRLDPEQELPDGWGPMAQLKVRVICDCGKYSLVRMCRLSLNTTSTCGKCNWYSKEHWLSQTWGKLRLDPDQELPEGWNQYAVKSFWFLCDCGHRVSVVMNDLCSSCGQCEFKPKNHWLQQRWGKLRLNEFQNLPEEWGRGFGGRLECICECGKKCRTTMNKLEHGSRKSCGCATPGTSTFSPAYKIFEFVRSIAPDAKFSHWFTNSDGKRREYDIYVPSKKLAIEYHGLIWHSEKFSKDKKDWKKYIDSVQTGVTLLQVYQDEWENRTEIIKTLIKGKLGIKTPKKRVDPVFSVEIGGTSYEGRSFLNQHHYLGEASGEVTVVARDKGGVIVGVWVFMKREAGVAVFHRASWHPSYKAWNPHEKALKTALPELKNRGFTRVITFSDNRLFSGDMYLKLGFKFEEQVRPNYYYTNATKRFTKYTFRVKAGINEVETAKEKGWYRIWDSGKKRFSMTISPLVV